MIVRELKRKSFPSDFQSRDIRTALARSGVLGYLRLISCYLLASSLLLLLLLPLAGQTIGRVHVNTLWKERVRRHCCARSVIRVQQEAEYIADRASDVKL